jgi:NTE family protein
MRMIATAAEFSSPSFLTMARLEPRLHNMRFHMIDSSNLASLQRAETQLLAYGPFLELLRGQGRERTLAWFSDHSDNVGRRSSIDMQQWSA